MWRDLIERHEPSAVFLPPASPDAIGSVEDRLGLEVPSPLRSLLRESDGVTGKYGVHILWSAARIAEQNEQVRLLDRYQPFDGLLFFADAGDGELFAVRADDPSVVVWNPIEDTRETVAPSLDAFLAGWLSGSLTV